LEYENKKLKEKLSEKERELLQKDSIINELRNKINRLEIENRNLKRECMIKNL